MSCENYHPSTVTLISITRPLPRVPEEIHLWFPRTKEINGLKWVNKSSIWWLASRRVWNKELPISRYCTVYGRYLFLACHPADKGFRIYECKKGKWKPLNPRWTKSGKKLKAQIVGALLTKGI